MNISPIAATITVVNRDLRAASRVTTLDGLRRHVDDMTQAHRGIERVSADLSDRMVDISRHLGQTGSSFSEDRLDVVWSARDAVEQAAEALFDVMAVAARPTSTNDDARLAADQLRGIATDLRQSVRHL